MKDDKIFDIMSTSSKNMKDIITDIRTYELAVRGKEKPGEFLFYNGKEIKYYTNPDDVIGKQPDSSDVVSLNGVELKRLAPNTKTYFYDAGKRTYYWINGETLMVSSIGEQISYHPTTKDFSFEDVIDLRYKHFQDKIVTKAFFIGKNPVKAEVYSHVGGRVFATDDADKRFVELLLNIGPDAALVSSMYSVVSIGRDVYLIDKKKMILMQMHSNKIEKRPKGLYKYIYFRGLPGASTMNIVDDVRWRFLVALKVGVYPIF